jgi:hypothetical protein
MDGGVAQRPVWGCNELKKKGARSARARTRGQNPLVNHKVIFFQLLATGEEIFKDKKTREYVKTTCSKRLRYLMREKVDF